MKHLTSYSFDFGGFLHGGRVSQIALSLAALAGIALLVFLYTRTLTALPARARRILTAMRAVFWLMLFLLLANPTRIERTMADAESKRPLAVVVDRSDSMTARDNRGRSRLDDAVRNWPALEAVAHDVFSRTDYFSFGVSLHAASDFSAAREQKIGGDETHLNESVAQVLQQQPPGGYGGIVCFTDGLDTTEQTPEKLADAALAARTPLYFVPSRNRLRPSEFLALRETDAPPQVRRRSQFEWRAVIEAFSKEARRVPVSLWQGDKPVVRATIDLPAGYSVVPWTSKVTADEPGMISYEMRVGSEASEQFGDITVRVVEKTAVPILYYQGALDWGYPFLAGILRRDPSFALTAIFNPSISLRAASNAPARGANDLPSSAQALKNYELLILASPFANQFTDAQQNALVDYVRGGGGILFIAPNAAACRAFAGTKIEEILPVAFEDNPEVPKNTGVALFEEQMQAQRGLGFDSDSTESDNSVASENAVKPPPLNPFVLTAAARQLPVFASVDGGKPVLPSFESYSRVKSAKPGAEVLAVNSAKEKRILLASQFFGKGHAAVLTSDSLWRWKLSLPSDSRDAEIFWQQLLLWLARPSSGKFWFEQNKSMVPIGKNVALKICGQKNFSTERTWEFDKMTSPNPNTGNGQYSFSNYAQPIITAHAISPSGKFRKLKVDFGPDGSDSVLASWTPDELGRWSVTASDADGNTAELQMHVVPSQQSRETSNLPPDIESMRKLAETTGGELILGDAPAGWLAMQHGGEPALASENRQPVWNHWILLLGSLAIFCAELIYRRRLKLL